MAIETLGEALDLSWRLHVRCAFGRCEGLKSIRACAWGVELDVETLTCTRGRDFPVDRLQSRLRCLRCGSRHVRLAFSPPANVDSKKASA